MAFQFLGEVQTRNPLVEALDTATNEILRYQERAEQRKKEEQQMAETFLNFYMNAPAAVREQIKASPNYENMLDLVSRHPTLASTVTTSEDGRRILAEPPEKLTFVKAVAEGKSLYYREDGTPIIKDTPGINPDSSVLWTEVERDPTTNKYYTVNVVGFIDNQGQPQIQSKFRTSEVYKTPKGIDYTIENGVPVPKLVFENPDGSISYEDTSAYDPQMATLIFQEGLKRQGVVGHVLVPKGSVMQAQSSTRTATAAQPQPQYKAEGDVLRYVPRSDITTTTETARTSAGTSITTTTTKKGDISSLLNDYYLQGVNIYGEPVGAPLPAGALTTDMWNAVVNYMGQAELERMRIAANAALLEKELAGKKEEMTPKDLYELRSKVMTLVDQTRRSMEFIKDPNNIRSLFAAVSSLFGTYYKSDNIGAKYEAWDAFRQLGMFDPMYDKDGQIWDAVMRALTPEEQKELAKRFGWTPQEKTSNTKSSFLQIPDTPEWRYFLTGMSMNSPLGSVLSQFITNQKLAYK